MAFLTEPQLREREIAASATEVSLAVSTDLRQEAIDQIAEWCGDGKVAEVAESTEDTREVRTFQKAQQKIFKAKLLMWNASRYRSGGKLISEKDLNDSSVNTYEKTADARREHDALLDEAKQHIEPYLLPSEEIIGDSTEFINFSATLNRKPVW
jgi:hypothetical protein